MTALLFANSFIGLEPTLFYDIDIPLGPFDSGLSWEPQPLETEFRLYFLELSARDWRQLDGRSFTLSDEQSDCSIYLGNVHNPVEVRLLEFTRSGPITFQIHAKLMCDFEEASVGKNVEVTLVTEVDYRGLVVEFNGDSEIDPSRPDAALTFLSSFVDLDAYDREVQLGKSLSRKLTGPNLVLLPNRP
jgi:hypothetical protein